MCQCTCGGSCVSVSMWLCVGVSVCSCGGLYICLCVFYSPTPPSPPPSQMNGNIEMSFTTVQKSFWWWHRQCSVMCVSLFPHLLGYHYPPGVPPSSPIRSTTLFLHLGSHTPSGVPPSSATSWNLIPHPEYLPLPPPPGISYLQLPLPPATSSRIRSTSLFSHQEYLPLPPPGVPPTSPTWDLIPHQESTSLPPPGEYLSLPPPGVPLTSPTWDLMPHQEYLPLPPPGISFPTRSTSPATPPSRTSSTRPALPRLATPPPPPPIYLQKTSDRGRVS